VLISMNHISAASGNPFRESRDLRIGISRHNPTVLNTAKAPMIGMTRRELTPIRIAGGQGWLEGRLRAAL